MWKCPNCEEAVEDSFETCWNCGTSADGSADPDFHRVEDDPTIPDPGAEAGPAGSETSRGRPAYVSMAYSSLADFALLIGQAGALVGCGLAIYSEVLFFRAESHVGVWVVAPQFDRRAVARYGDVAYREHS